MKSLAILGATGSIGDSTSAVVRKHPNHFKVHTLTGHTNSEKLIELAKEFRPSHVVVTNDAQYTTVKTALNHLQIQVHSGIDALDVMVTDSEVDVVVAGVVGNAGMSSVLAAVTAGKTLLLANKEAIVAAGGLVMKAAKFSGAKIIPLDSEHNAIFQCLGEQYVVGCRPKDVKSITLTASGGPFWQTEKNKFPSITPAQAVAHPKWNMGAKISVDSATLMNKGLEIIEAHWLFNMPNEDINVLIHPQSIIHSMVNYIDGSVLSQMGNPDMEIPISHGLGMSLNQVERLENNADFLELLAQELTFHTADLSKFKCLQLARDAMEAGGNAAAVLNAANEISVASFLAEKIRFDQIGQCNDKIMNHFPIESVMSLDQLKDIDREVRVTTEAYINTL